MLKLHLLLDQLHVLVQPALHAPHLAPVRQKCLEKTLKIFKELVSAAPAADPELLTHEGDQLLVVADEDDAALVVGQTHAQRLDRLDVQVIRRLV